MCIDVSQWMGDNHEAVAATATASARDSFADPSLTHLKFAKIAILHRGSNTVVYQHCRDGRGIVCTSPDAIDIARARLLTRLLKAMSLDIENVQWVTRSVLKESQVPMSHFGADKWFVDQHFAWPPTTVWR